MRIIVRDVLEPFLKRQEDDREQIILLKKAEDKINIKLDELDFIVNKSNQKSNKYDDIKQQLLGIESNFALRHNEIYQKLNGVNSFVASSVKNIENIYDITKEHDSNLNKLENEIEHFRVNILDTKTYFSDQITMQSEKNIKLIDKINKTMIEIKKNADESVSQSQLNTNRINVIENLQENIYKNSSANAVEIKNL